MKTLILVLLIIYSAWQTETFEQSYQEGFAFLQARNFQSAIAKFKYSYKINRNYKTAYYIALCYSRMHSVDSCKKYAQIVMNDSQTPANYKLESRNMYNSTQSNISVSGRMESETDK
ncbi:hypothetical protein [Mucilaginibacter rubeus]|uniref:Tetratricopeptide repeat protein n=1 Tax=Mucilaginibacter rubeus TaxID=2027860 RepID=A0A5C1HXQ0_9SPHI|nr:hypothetical protein [Mucilaginibacter rubeus]QEM10209.1 hypothetical protein DEO27_009280 [Mucilaginibacter rubeus]